MNNWIQPPSLWRIRRYTALFFLVLVGVEVCCISATALYSWYKGLVAEVQIATNKQQIDHLQQLVTQHEHLGAQHRQVTTQQEVLRIIDCKLRYAPAFFLDVIADSMEEDMLLLQAKLKRKNIELKGLSTSLESLQRCIMQLNTRLSPAVAQLNTVQWNTEQNEYQFLVTIGGLNGD